MQTRPDYYHFNMYQNSLEKFCVYPDHDKQGLKSAYYSILELFGELGEVCEKMKKILRDKKGVISDEDRELLVKEFGDGLFGLARVCWHLNINLSEVAEGNIEKLESRLARNVIHGSGDNR